MASPKFQIRKVISANRLLSATLHVALRKRNYSNFRAAKEASRKIPVYNEIDQPVNFPMYPTDSAIDNIYYGIGETLKEYAGLKKQQTRTYVEHGVFFGQHLQFDQKDHWAPKIITFSRVREYHLADHGVKKTILPIGPYIQYARNNVSDADFAKLKSDLGRVLLVIPGHSTTTIHAQFDTKKLIKNINAIREGYDTVLVLCYYLDLIHRDHYQNYIDAGYKIASAGHKFDPDFLHRLRTIISLADYTISNHIGTHIGYCLALDKPHFLIDQDFKQKKNTAKAKELYEGFRKSRTAEIEEVAQEFRIHSRVIRASQRKIVEKYWGADELKSPEELRQFLDD